MGQRKERDKDEALKVASVYGLMPALISFLLFLNIIEF